MQHISLTPDGLPHLTVPFYTRRHYDGQGFATYGDRTGLVTAGRLDVRCSAEVAASLLQSWLYFGLLHEVLEEHFDHDAYINVEEQTVDSVALHQQLDAWQAALRRAGPQACDQKLMYMRRTLAIAVDASSMFDHIKGLGIACLSTKLMILSLIHIHNVLDADNAIDIQVQDLIPLDACRPLQSLDDEHLSGATSTLITEMLAAGWCQSMVKRMCSSYDYYTVYYMSRLVRTRNTGHDQCTLKACLKYSVTTDSYVVKHTTTDCKCQHIFVDVEKVTEIINDDGLPLVQLAIDDNDIPTVHVTREPSRMPDEKGFYCAISHLWADGMGNPTANSLPACQVRYLADLLKRQPEKSLWLDTFCIPVNNETIRRKAIDSMPYVYRNAGAVVVIDHEIQTSCKASGHSNKEPREAQHVNDAIHLRASVLCSAWNSRCWTYHEAVLSQYLFFVTKEGSASPFLMATHASIVPDHVTHDAERSWALWRGKHTHKSPRTLINLMQSALHFVPPADCFMLAYNLCCGPQAAAACLESLRSHSGNIFAKCYSSVGAAAWLLMAVLLGLSTIAPYLASVSIGALAGSIIAALLLVVASTPEPFLNFRTLDMEFALQLSRYLEQELQPPLITKQDELTCPDIVDGIRRDQCRQTWNALTWRSTTKTEDIHTIMAQLFDVSALGILSLSDPKDRIRALMATFKHLPIGLLFDETSARDPQNKWLPLAPGHDVLTPGPLCVDADHVRIKMADFDSSLVAFTGNGSDDHFSINTGRGRVHLQLDVSTILDVSAEKSTELSNGPCLYLLELPADAILKAHPTAPILGAKLQISSCLEDVHFTCHYERPVRFRLAPSATTSTPATVLHADSTIELPFHKSMLSAIDIRTPWTSTTRTTTPFFVFAAVIAVLLWDVLAALIVCGVKVGWATAGIAWAVVFVCAASLVVLAVVAFRGLQQGTRGRRMGLIARAAAMFMEWWLPRVSKNLAHKGDRWYKSVGISRGITYARPRNSLLSSY